jgi:hypothetical protein
VATHILAQHLGHKESIEALKTILKRFTNDPHLSARIRNIFKKQ